MHIKPRRTVRPTQDEFVTRVLRYRDEHGRGMSPDCFSFTGDEREGVMFSSNGQGDHFALAWNADAVVAFSHDHHRDNELDLDFDERHPERVLVPAPPPELATLINLAAEASERLASGGFWIQWSGGGSRFPLVGLASDDAVLQFVTPEPTEAEQAEIVAKMLAKGFIVGPAK